MSRTFSIVSGSAFVVAGLVTSTLCEAAPAAPLETATVHLASGYDATWLQARRRVDLDEWQWACRAPCDRSIDVGGYEMRVVAPHMTSSNSFVIEPGTGAVGLRVSGGSSVVHTTGIVGLVAGLPVALGGMTLYGLGKLNHESEEKTAGFAMLIGGSAALLLSLPLLLIGRTTVYDARGRSIAGASPALVF